MQVLVTGAAGFIGSHLVDVILERGDFVRALVRPGEATDRLRRAGVDICIGDLCDRASLEAAVGGMDRVLHCAASIKRARNELGFSPKTNSAEGVRRSVAWFLEKYHASGTGGRR